MTIGAFDGVHLGHRRLIERVRRTATDIGAVATIVTFDRHPASVVRPESAPLLLTDLDQKLALLEACGADLTLVVHFDAERAAERAEDFVGEVLVGCLNARAVIVGHDFHFGHNREGDVPLLQRMGAQMGFDVTGIRLLGAGGAATSGIPASGIPASGIPASGIPASGIPASGIPDGTGTDAGGGEMLAGAEPISSTRIRRLIAEGDVAGAAALLGRWYELRGLVGHGEKRGRELGFPTANLEVSKEMQICADGVYAGWYLRPDGTRHQTAISVGRQPTFYESRPYSLVEAHLLDFQGDLYDEVGTVELVARLRGQEKFGSVEALIDQMSSDVAQTRRTLATRSPQ